MQFLSGNAGFVQFIHREVTDSFPQLLETCHRRLIMLLTQWKTVAQINQANRVIYQTYVIKIMLAYLYRAAYTMMIMNESSPPCEQGRITFNDDGQRVQFARPVLPAPHYICMYRLLPTKPHHRLGIINSDLLTVPIYRPRKDG